MPTSYAKVCSILIACSFGIFLRVCAAAERIRYRAGICRSSSDPIAIWIIWHRQDRISIDRRFAGR